MAMRIWPFGQGDRIFTFLRSFLTRRCCLYAFPIQNVHAIRKPTSPHIRVTGFTKTRSQNDEIACWFGMNATRNETSVWGKLSFWHFWTSWDDCSRSSWHQSSTHWSFKFHGSHRHLERSTSTHHDTMKFTYSTNEKGMTNKFDWIYNLEGICRIPLCSHKKIASIWDIQL